MNKVTKRAMPMGDELRIIVDRWGDGYVYGNDKGGDIYKISIADAFSYMKELLRKGVVINLVRPRMEDGTVYPELIIFEPDLLINVSTIAACFESYGNSPIIRLLNEVKPAANSSATLLGNFASQLLDEEIQGQDVPYAQSVKRFFDGNALSLLTTELSDTFHNESKSQKENIHKALGEIEHVVSSFNREEVILEPSFFCPTLGIQGRMDLLQMDMNFLIEQKSGTCAFPYPSHTGEKPTQRGEHYVQMLLYMALIRYNFSTSDEAPQAFLLYSKYQESLCQLGFFPGLLSTAIMIRNQIAWHDIRCADGGFRLLGSISHDKLNQKGGRGKLWESHVRPRLEEILSPIGKADELEREYYYRFMTFIAKEHLLSRVGDKTVGDFGFASTWLCSLESKRELGNIYERLKLISPTTDNEGMVEQVVLSFADDDSNDMTNFRKGDIVILYPYDKDAMPMAWKSIVMRCSVVDIAGGEIRLRMRFPQSSNKFFRRNDDMLWAIEHDFMESSYGSEYRAMHSFLSAPQGRKDLILMRRTPTVDRSLSLVGDYQAFNELALRVKRAKDLFLIIGPPGTGKTSYGMLNTLKEELFNPEACILLVSYTNRAVDEMCIKLLEEGIDFLRLGNELSTSAEIFENLLKRRIATCKKLGEVKDIVSSTRVFAGTTSSLGANAAILKMRHFSLAIVDEASQILEPDIMGLLCANADGTPSVDKFVFIGDHKQLPAVVSQSRSDSAVSDPKLNAIGLTDCRLSLFERLLSRYRNNPDVYYMLTKQGRMHRDIAEFPSKAFYQGKLEVVPLAHQTRVLPVRDSNINCIEDILRTRRIAFIASPSPTADQYVSDKVNVVEAEIIANIACSIYKICVKDFNTDKTLGIIVPYRNQIATIRNIIDTKVGSDILHDITIDTVERFQGSQRDYIIYGLTIQKPYQLDFLTENAFEEDGFTIDRKLNVAMTRAREHLLVIGNPTLLGGNAVFNSLLDFTKVKHSYFDMR